MMPDRNLEDCKESGPEWFTNKRSKYSFTRKNSFFPSLITLKDN